MSIRDRIIEEVNKSLDLARTLFPSFANCPRPAVEFYAKGRAAGWAHGYRKLRFNEHVLAQDAAMMVNTVSHEVAHIVCAFTGLGKGHNPGWKRVHRMLGGNAERCYSGAGLDVKLARVQAKYEHRATCGTVINLSAVMHKRIMAGQVRILKSTRGRLTAQTFTGRVV